jgi:hypothetical protein
VGIVGVTGSATLVFGILVEHVERFGFEEDVGAGGGVENVL